MNKNKRDYRLAAYSGVLALLPGTQAAYSLPINISPIDIAAWTLDAGGNALVQLLNGEVHTLPKGIFEIAGGRLVPAAASASEAVVPLGAVMPLASQRAEFPHLFLGAADLVRGVCFALRFRGV